MAVTETVSYSAAFLVGLAGSPHCVGMCGGIVSLFNLAGQAQQNSRPRLALNTVFQLGRVSCYALLGALVGASGALMMGERAWLGDVFRWASMLLLVSIAFSIIGWWSPGKWLEKAGSGIWARMQPLARHFLPVRNHFSAYFLGVIWGFLPCGLIYSALAWALTTGDPLQASLMMVLFGLGTMPALLGIGFLAGGFKRQMRRPAVRYSLAVFLVALAVLPFYMHAMHTGHTGHTGHAGHEGLEGQVDSGPHAAPGLHHDH